MNPVWPTLRRILDALTESGASVALVGGLAVGVRCEPRFTRDVDLAVAVADDAEAEALVRALLARGYRAFDVLEQEAAGRLATVRLRCPPAEADTAVVDLLFASSGIEREIVERAEEVAVGGGLVVPVARTAHLIATKLLSATERRPQDAIDLANLVRAAGEAELGDARDAVRLIESRGFARSRDLVAALDAAIASARDD